MNTSKPKVIKEFDKLTDEMQEAVMEKYADGFTEHIVRFTDQHGKYINAVPFETEDRYYLVKMANLVTAKPFKDDDPSDGPADNDREDKEEDTDDKFTDLDTMQVGGKKRDDDDDFD